MSLVAPNPGGVAAPCPADVAHVRVPLLCPRCGAQQAVLLGVAEYGCGRCGAVWPMEAVSLLPRPREGSRPDVTARAVNSGPACVLAWSLGEGDLLPGGVRVVSVQRDPVRGVASVGTPDGMRRFGREDRVVVACRAGMDGVSRRGWRLGVFVTAARNGRYGPGSTAAAAPAGSVWWGGGRRGDRRVVG